MYLSFNDRYKRSLNIPIGIRISKKNRQHTGQRKKDKQKSTKHTQNTNDQATGTPLKPVGELMCIGKVDS
jgi:hypothetical protein